MFMLREVKILKDVQRMERDRDMMIRAGYPQEHISYFCFVLQLKFLLGVKRRIRSCGFLRIFTYTDDGLCKG